MDVRSAPGSQRRGDRSKAHTRQSSYPLPLDDLEFDRLDQQHYLLTRILGRLPRQPAQTGQTGEVMELRRGLEVGCANGTWVLEAAATWPQCQWTGIDPVPAYPAAVHPANVEFQSGDIVQGLAFEDGHFDYVHARDIGLGIQLAQWPQVLREYARLLASGGVLELVEWSLPFLVRPPGDSLGLKGEGMDLEGYRSEDLAMYAPITARIQQLLEEALGHLGVDMHLPGNLMSQWWKDASLSELLHLEHQVPFGMSHSKYDAEERRMAREVVVGLVREVSRTTMGQQQNGSSSWDEELLEQWEQELEHVDVAWSLHIFYGRKRW
ncbi:MAG: S-adenosyl-L-methionine-dependent methyltransferase [Piptocephalis tieghemiana]|nr:MAG: S-adenosyl-L-methionine-dependent methyltransferase [Piptocephalis tieghemiana]